MIITIHLFNGRLRDIDVPIERIRYVMGNIVRTNRTMLTVTHKSAQAVAAALKEHNRESA